MAFQRKKGIEYDIFIFWEEKIFESGGEWKALTDISRVWKGGN